jgi:hypothetical protein
MRRYDEVKYHLLKGLRFLLHDLSYDVLNTLWGVTEALTESTKAAFHFYAMHLCLLTI